MTTMTTTGEAKVRVKARARAGGESPIATEGWG
jgi:hypothetical protein